ncbi:hypothetical protein AX774_g5610 [Zancudomyces culisetae]|uniref:Proteasome component Ecm29 N-terminal domain-containing protein n=1 Tax=Zancudomyces culisetae TaxID=1213189 RepID=A0A1R1PJ27_ZANCU|nr:hypothetical protein AX774_g5610 [Zancudomyces culisetae]|eukprot:OMH80957.1 hypothetical protein AX774_g5610 [Zancudomyces culisetae]
MELRLPIQELFELYESQIQKTGENVRSIDLGLFYIQKAFERTPDNEKGLYLERLLKEVTLKSMPQQRIINSILLQLQKKFTGK